MNACCPSLDKTVESASFWKIADRESAEVAAEFITEVCRDRQIDRLIRGGLVLHSDNGNSEVAIATTAKVGW